MKKISIFRDRGQLTIPDQIRKYVGWATPMSAVSISVADMDQIIIQPHYQTELNWNDLWRQIKRVRAFTGKGRGNLSGFIAEDREARR